MVMNKFEEDRKIEKRFCALVNYFQLLVIGQQSNQDYNNFYLLEGMKRISTLINDIQQGNIHLYKEDGSGKETSELYYEMIGLCTSLEAVTISVSPIVLSELQKVDSITSYCSENDYFNGLYPANFEVLLALPLEVAQSYELGKAILKPQPQKKIGERK